MAHTIYTAAQRAVALLLIYLTVFDKTDWLAHHHFVLHKMHLCKVLEVLEVLEDTAKTIKPLTLR